MTFLTPLSLMYHYLHHTLHYVVKLLVLIGLFVNLNAPAALAQEDKKNDIPEGWKLVPRVGVYLEYGGFAFQEYDYASMLKRYLEIDLLQYRRHIFYLVFDEKTFFGTPGNKWEFNLLKFDVVLGGYRYDFGEFYLGLFLHHRCNSLFLTQNYQTKTGRERANVYDVGLEFLTKNLRVGMKDRGIPFDPPDDFEFLSRFAGGFWGSKTLIDDQIDLQWIMRGQIRYDILQYKHLIPYIEATAEAFIGPDNRVIPSAEVGVRYRLSPKVDITPFFKWSRDQLALTSSFDPHRSPLVTSNYLFGGVRLETLLDKDNILTSKSNELQLFPETHGQAGYAFFLNNPNSKGHGDIQLYFHALQWQSWTIFLDTNMKLNTRKENLKPDKVTYALHYGLTHYWDKYFLEGYIKNQSRLDSNIYRGTTEQRNLGGVRAGTKGMKPGYYDFGISFEGPETFQWLNNWQAQVGVGHYFHNSDWRYLWDVMAQVRWDVIRWNFVIPYIQGDVNWMAGGSSTRDSWEYVVEPGLRFHGIFDLAIYYRFQYIKNNLFFLGPSEKQSLIGIKALF